MTKKSFMGLIAFILVAVIVVVAVVACGIGSSVDGKWFKNGDVQTWFDSWGQGEPSDSEDDDKDVQPVGEGFLIFAPRTTVDSPVSLSTETTASESKSATITATIEPPNGFYKAIDWRSSSNAVKVTQDVENPLKAHVELVGKLFSEATITCIVVSTKTFTATCAVNYLSYPKLSDLFVYTSDTIKFGEEVNASVTYNFDLLEGATFEIEDYCLDLKSEVVQALLSYGDFGFSWDGTVTPPVRECTFIMADDPVEAFYGGSDKELQKENLLKAFFKCSNDVQGDKLVPKEVATLKLDVWLTYQGVRYKAYEVKTDVCFDNSYITEITGVTIENGNIVFHD